MFLNCYQYQNSLHLLPYFLYLHFNQIQMKKFLIVIFTLAFFTSCQSNTKKIESNSKLVNYETIELTVTGMTCSACENTIENGLKQVDGVVEVKASHKNGRVSIKMEKDKVNREEITQQIESIGYNVEK